jgi:hypothetical protein
MQSHLRLIFGSVLRDDRRMQLWGTDMSHMFRTRIPVTTVGPDSESELMP